MGSEPFLPKDIFLVDGHGSVEMEALGPVKSRGREITMEGHCDRGTTRAREMSKGAKSTKYRDLDVEVEGWKLRAWFSRRGIVEQKQNGGGYGGAHVET
jgi:hypothetical protein